MKETQTMKKLITGAMLALSTAATPALAGPNGTFEEHQGLWTALQRAGITLKTNTSDCKETGGGKYFTYRRLLVICQDNAKVWDGKQVSWTANDLDTLRHEGHHVVQDCNEGGIGDGKLANLFHDEDELISFLTKSSWSKDEILGLIEDLEEDGLDFHAVKLEVEAYTVASDISATSITNKVNDFCGESTKFRF